MKYVHSKILLSYCTQVIDIRGIQVSPGPKSSEKIKFAENDDGIIEMITYTDN